MTRFALAAACLAGLAALGGCLEVPAGPAKECSVDSDCNTGAGEVCDEGVCYGDPPAGQFAATIAAPATREDLVSAELAVLSLPADGWLGDLALERPVVISGRVEAYCATANQTCSTASIAAEIRLTRPSRFPGGPSLRFTAQSAAGVPRGTDSFTIKVPQTQAGDEPYTVTIDPEGGGEQPPTDGNIHPAEVVPPKRLMLTATGNNEHQTYTLGGPNPVTITGSLKDALGTSLVGYRVVALGHFDSASAKTEVSTVDFVTNGQYSITLADGVAGQIELVATPYEHNVVAPELHLSNMSPIPGALTLGQPPGLGDPAILKIPVKGQAGDGMVKPVVGARVIVSGVVDPSFAGAAVAELTSEAITDDNGIATLSLLDGSAIAPTYRLRVVPPASSNLGVVYDSTISLEAPATVQLPSRVALRGTVVDFAGNPVAGVSVTARRSQQFLWTLPPEDQGFLDEIPAATTITPEGGDFVVWVDPSLADAWGHYDVTFETPKGSTSPTWRVLDVEIPRVAGQSAVALGNVTIPDAAFLHGRIVDLHGEPVENSAVRIFQIPPPTTLCTELSHAPDDCELDAQVVANGQSDSNGIVRLDLARP